MFQSYEHIHYMGYDPKVKQHKWQYKIVDSDFEHIGVEFGVEFGFGVCIAIGFTVIVSYSQRDLPVAPNLIRALLWCQKQYGFTLDQLVGWNKEYNSRWSEVEKDMQKYLLFS